MASFQKEYFEEWISIRFSYENVHTLDYWGWLRGTVLRGKMKTTRPNYSYL